MRSSKASRAQLGGEGEQPAAPSDVTPPVLPKSFFTNSAASSGSALAMSGGKKKKPAAAKKPAKPAKAKKGGSLAAELKSLAVPFAILLAKQGLDGLLDSKKKGPAKKAIEVSTKRKTAVGGGCSACAVAPSAPKAGGGSSNSRYAKLAREIDNFLAKY